MYLIRSENCGRNHTFRTSKSACSLRVFITINCNEIIEGPSIKATVQSRECTVIYRSKTEIVGANPAPGREISFRSLFAFTSIGLCL
jgi:hypothetical protein